MRHGPDAVKLELWRRRLREFQRGTETVAAFCRRVGVSAATFYLWRRRVSLLTAERSGRQPSGRSISNSNGTAVPPLSFLPVQVTDQPPSMIEVLLTDGTRVRVPSGDRESLQVVLDVITGAWGQPSC